WANDGGQRIAPYWDSKWGRGYNGTANGNYRDIGGLTRFERSDRYVYTAADATRAYNSTEVTTGKNKAKVSLVQREFVYLRSPGGDDDYFVVFDRVEAAKPDFKKLWLLQLRARPEFDGTARVTVGTEAGGIHLSENTTQVTVRQERSQLRSTTLLPKKENRVVRRLGGSMTTALKKPLRSADNGPVDIEVASTSGMPEHPTVIITNQPPDPNREVFDRYSVWPQAAHASGKSFSDRVAYFCEGKTKPDQIPARLLDCVRAIKSSPGFDIPAGARVIQEFRHMGVEGVDRGNDAERIDYPWGYGFGYSYGDGNQYGLWRVEVSPKKATKSDNFLHVIHPSLKDGAGRDAVLIESRDDTLYGAHIGDRAVLFAKGADFLTKGSYSLNGTGKVWQLVCNLKPGREYQVRQDGRMVVTATASAQGTLTFEASLVGRPSLFEFSVVAGKGR
ncbi:partial Heparin and heparin-sulfate lyase, partial [Planctomycetaceae bacterium]